MAERIRPVEQMLELSEEEAMSPEHLDSQVQKAQEQLLQLKRQSEQIEKQKRELEELSRRQEELERGRAEMTDKLSRSLVILEREGYDSQKKLEQIRATHESFTQHLQLLEGIEPKTWNPARDKCCTYAKSVDGSSSTIRTDMDLRGNEEGRLVYRAPRGATGAIEANNKAAGLLLAV